jgi:hypothetical protein
MKIYNISTVYRSLVALVILLTAIPVSALSLKLGTVVTIENDESIYSSSNGFELNVKYSVSGAWLVTDQVVELRLEPLETPKNIQKMKKEDGKPYISLLVENKAALKELKGFKIVEK